MLMNIVGISLNQATALTVIDFTFWINTRNAKLKTDSVKLTQMEDVLNVKITTISTEDYVTQMPRVA